MPIYMKSFWTVTVMDPGFTIYDIEYIWRNCKQCFTYMLAFFNVSQSFGHYWTKISLDIVNKAVSPSKTMDWQADRHQSLSQIPSKIQIINSKPRCCIYITLVLGLHSIYCIKIKYYWCLFLRFIKQYLMSISLA